jgi:hypothetical protein
MRERASARDKCRGEIKVIKSVIVVSAALSLCACATITRGTTQAFEVKTTPVGAAVTTSTGLNCPSTPCVFPNVPRNSNFDVTITKPGYKTHTAKVTNTTSSAGGMGMAGNILLGGIIGAAVDGTNGSMQDLTPNPLEITLEPEGAAPAAAPLAAAAPAPATGAGS